jgi:GTP-binding protein
MTADAQMPVVAVVGRPNVGKSSLVNRILGQREAIVQETPGVTRDRRSFVAEWGGRTFQLFDTGGLEPSADGLERRVGEQAEVAIEVADVIVFVVDARTGPLEDDLVVANMLRRAEKPVVVAANKIDDARDEPSGAEFYRLGLGPPHVVSALHGRGSGDLLDALIEALPSDGGARPDEWGAVAIVGRPNVGKSSLLNRLVREERAIVDPVPGTTRDPVDSILQLGDGRRIRLVDTAGMRRGVQIKDEIEYFSWLRSRGVLRRIDGAILVVDASQGVTGQDQRLAEDIVDAGRACVIVMNKWDLLTRDETERKRFDEAVADRVRFLSWAEILRTSAVTGRGVEKVVRAVGDALEAHRMRLPTPEVNRIVQAAQDHRPHPRTGGRSIRVLYAVQAGVKPPTFVLFSTGRIEPSYTRYLENRIRERHRFRGSPLRFEVRRKPRRELQR